MLKEIHFEEPQDERPKGENCPRCGGETRYTGIPCPDGRVGCLVYHQGWVCQKCGGIFEESN